MLIYIVRHGLTEWNKLKKLQGIADVPLAEEGILLAEKTGEALRGVKFDICFTSPLSRARQTAECVLGKRDVPIIPDKRIQEIDFGVLEGDQVRDIFVNTFGHFNSPFMFGQKYIAGFMISGIIIKDFPGKCNVNTVECLNKLQSILICYEDSMRNIDEINLWPFKIMILDFKHI